MSEAMDPADASVESVLPGVCSRIDNLQNGLNSVQKGMNEMNSNFEAHFSNVIRKVDSVRYDISNVSAFMAHIRSFQPLEPDADSDSLPRSPESPLPSVVPTLTDENSRENSRPERVYNLCIKHSSIFDMWDEWHGMGQFRAELNEFCYPGGIDALEKTFGIQWRRHFNCTQQKIYSRTKYVIEKIKEIISSNQAISQDIILGRFQELYLNRKRSISSMEAFLKKQ
jgi:hypothetical protein